MELLIDTLIIQTAVGMAMSLSAVIMGSDTDPYSHHYHENPELFDTFF
jgi:hypothetical protein